MGEIGAKFKEPIPDWISSGIAVYGSATIVYAFLAMPFSGFLNQGVFNFLFLFGIAEGSLFDNTWIAGLVEPLISKLFPLLVIGLLGPVVALFRISAAFALLGIAITGLRQVGYSLAASTEKGLFFLVVLIFVFHQIYIEGQDLDFPEQYNHHPWLTGCLFGSIVGLVELVYYLSTIGTDIYLRIAPLIMHTVLGGLICGTWILLSSQEDSWRNEAIAWGSILIAMAFHATFNSWLAEQQWFRQFWENLVFLL